MDAVPLARALGWASLGFGVASLAAPGRVAALSGFPGRPEIAIALGVRDLAIGAGLAASRDPRPWLRWRAPRWSTRCCARCVVPARLRRGADRTAYRPAATRNRTSEGTSSSSVSTPHSCVRSA
jgi:hypothetical protein